ncbi:MAG: leucyl aminopeptidase [Alphaproteobacteria bacterium]|nr:MAG: leucyl aminopeptidase [Alphaproteobacteria bacterium]
MTEPLAIKFSEIDTSAFPAIEGQIAAFADTDGKMDLPTRRLDRLTRGALSRAVGSDAFGKLKEAEGMILSMPHGLKAERLMLVKLARRPDPLTARRAGCWIAAKMARKPLTVLSGAKAAVEIAFGLALRAYEFDVYKVAKKSEDNAAMPREARILVSNPEEAAAASRDRAALVEGVFFTRDLVNEPANVLSTTDFAARLGAMQELGLDVEILQEEELEKLGMRALLAVGRGSENPSRVVVMHWHGDGDVPPVALIGKGVVFDTGGISIKPASGMEEMTMDMGGAGVVAGTMRALALRRARANVIGIVGLVENMPDGRAQRPGDIVTSMKGDTIEVINTDAEGRLVLADLLWYAQEHFAPSAMIDLATLTGAMIIALGHHKAGFFANDDALAEALARAAAGEGEGAWRMPLDKAYDRQLKSRLADIKNVGGRPAGSITAAQFLQRFVKDGTAWAHIDIAGVTLPPEATDCAPKGATGWGVLTLDRLIRERCESKG